ncbi:Major facilitator superfamily domain, general substrate transporter [Metarhizium robertsii ARSEF 23]|uniref:Major facilitator superfamily domain, general substrate transporter n=1 Tax=Metarhizium robertsii (strain ARSEF 23 / ATCC MYA-3075) TaxID=655844 RepID=E9F697_METRA|nr:Major facilitator superfamily domain, general substrate transporter [Metarhizium robertsii ARSEF 23]EFY96735.2 Major facilitator superfamily domain, general substrate transporter [Metarhizium robertsii ARSEF 23]
MTTTTTDTVAETVQNIPLTETPHAATVDAPPHPSPAATLKLISVGFSFFVAGVNDGSTGALLPYVIREYGISTAIVSSVATNPVHLSARYGANFAGWFSAAVANAHLCSHLDLGAMLALGAACQVAAHSLRAWDPPFGLFVTTFWLVSVGQAFQDTHGNTLAAGVAGAHRWLAAIHAAYMAGCLAGPFAATAVAAAPRRGGTSSTRSRWPWASPTWPWCWLPFATRCGSGRTGTGTGARGRREAARGGLIRATAATPSVWFLCAFFFFYLGSVLTAGGWVVEYLVDVRRGSLSQVGYVPAGFSGGALLGRLLLAEPTHRFGERGMVFVYCLLSTGLQLVFWLVPNIIAASIAVSFIGFFTGPLFATGISLGSKLFPAHIHSTALALVFVSAQMGGSLFPVITGVVSSNAGVQVLQPILVGLLAATALSWLCVPRPKDSAHAGLHQE